MDSIQPHQLILPMDMAQTAESFGPVEAIGAATIANYPLALTETLPAVSQEIGSMNSFLDLDAISEAGVVGTRPRYYSLDIDRMDTDTFMPLSSPGSLNDDAKENAKEVGHDHPP